MVQADYAAADAASGRVAVICHERSHAGVGTQDAGARERRAERTALAEQEAHLVRSHLHVVALLERDLRGCSSDDGDGVSGNEDVAVRRLAAAVDDHVVDAVPEHQQRALCGIHADMDAGLFSDSVPPDSCGIDGDRGPVFGGFAGAGVQHLHTEDRVTLADEVKELRVHQHLGSMHDGVRDVGAAQAERIHRAVRHHNGAYQGRIDGRFHFNRFPGRNGAGLDAGLVAGFQECGLVIEPETGIGILGQGDEQAARVVHAVGGYAAENLVLPYAFFC